MKIFRMISKILFLSFLFFLTIVLTLALPKNISNCAATAFSDVKESDWFYSDLVVLQKCKIIDGFTDGTFRPQDVLTKSQFLKLLTVAVNPYKVFEKDSNSWFQPYLDNALEMGIIDFEDANINFNEPISREETAHYAYVAMNLGKGNVREERPEEFLRQNNEIKSSIKDFDKISEEYQNEIIGIYKAGVIKGYKDGNFGPKNKLTRSEVTAIIRRVINYRNELRNQRLINYEDIKGYIFSDDLEEYNIKNINTVTIFG